MEYIDHFPVLAEQPGALQLSEKPTIDSSCHIVASNIGAFTYLAANTSLIESSFGDYSYTAGDVQIIYSEIGKFCSIANSVRINPGNHPQWRVTQHHMTYRRKEYGLADSDDKAFFEWRRKQQCKIGHDVWIGHGAIIMPGVIIGTGAVIGSGAVVTKNIGPYEVAVGVPAKVIKKRFTDEIIGKLIQSAWWDWDRSSLQQNFNDLLNTEIFIAKHVNQKKYEP